MGVCATLHRTLGSTSKLIYSISVARSGHAKSSLYEMPSECISAPRRIALHIRSIFAVSTDSLRVDPSIVSRRQCRRMDASHSARPAGARTRALAVLLLLLTTGLALSPPAAAAALVSPREPAVVEPDDRADADGEASTPRWDWPLPAPHRVATAYEAPAHDYGPGHRGIDIEAPSSRGPSSGAPGESAEAEVTAPDAGTVAFAGSVAGRGVVTIDHGGGLVSTLEPVVPLVAAGDVVARGEAIGTLSTGGHAPPGQLHLGARLDGEYINPLRLLGDLPWAVLLPCCTG